LLEITQTRNFMPSSELGRDLRGDGSDVLESGAFGAAAPDASNATSERR
jgi:hypothetical protein